MSKLFPGVPPVGSLERVAFFSAFWPALYSGIIYSLVTGIVVGLAVWSAQLLIDRRRVRREYEENIDRLFDEIRWIVLQPDVLRIDSVRASIPRVVDDVVECSLRHPLHSWLKTVKTRKRHIKLLIDVQNESRKVVLTARRLDDALTRVIRKYNAAEGLISSNDDILKVYSVGRIHAAEPDQILPWLGIPAPNVPEWVIAGYDIVMSDDEVAEGLRLYLSQRERLEGFLTNLKDLLQAENQR